jgi:cell division septation protein DedD
MPKLNLRDDEFEEDSNPLDSDQSVAPPPTLREVGGGEGGGKSSTLIMVVVLLLAVGLGVFALNYFKVIHLWGKKVPKVTATMDNDLPLPDAQGATIDAGAAPPPAGAESAPGSTPTPDIAAEPNPPSNAAASKSADASKPTKVKGRAKAGSNREPAQNFTPPPSGSGTFTVQVSSWMSRATAEKEAARLSAAGMSAFVEDATIAGENWYRVRVGRYETSKEAKQAADQLSKSVAGQIWVAKAGGK